MRRQRAIVLAVCGWLCTAGGVASAEPGDDDLAQAVAEKLTAENFNQLGEVARLCQQAIAKGLDTENESFAKRLLASTLIQRATILSQVLLESGRADAEFSRQAPQMFRAALAELEAALAADPQHPDAHYLLGRLNLVRGGDRKRAKEALDEALRLYGDDAEGKAKTLTARAALHENVAEQLADFNEAVALAPGSLESLRSRGAWYLQHGKSQEALADFEAALALEPRHAATLEARGVARAALGQPEQALADLAQAIEISPQLPGPYAQRARILAELGKRREALADLNEAIARAPANPALLLSRAQLHLAEGDAEAALRDLTDTLHARPNLSQALRARANLLATLGRYAEAETDLAALVKLDAGDGDALARLGTVYLATKQTEKSIEHYTKALAIDPQNVLALQGRADALTSLGRQREALADYEAALRVKPDNTGVLNNLAWLLATSPDDRLRDGQRAVELARSACEATKYEQPSVLSTLAAGYAEQGDFAAAVEWSTKAVELAAPEMKEHLRKELESYQAGKPWREGGATDPPGAPSSAEPGADAGADARNTARRDPPAGGF